MSDVTIPPEVGFFFAAALVGVAAWVLLTYFHPRWRRTIHWGRMRMGPPLSSIGRFVVATTALSFALWCIALSVQPSLFTRLAQTLAAIMSAALIAIFIYDLWVWKR